MSVEETQRSSLPIPDAAYVGTVLYDAKDPAVDFPPIEPHRPPAGAPNVLIVLLDDVGFGASSVFGGQVNTPTAERLAAGGLRFTRFHTTAICSPTRAALISGRNHHTVGMGGHHRDGHVGARLQLDAAEYLLTAARDSQTQRVHHRTLRKMSRGPDLGG